MKKIDITVDNKTYTFICEWHNTRSGFAHDCTLFINNSEVTTAHCYYINRTWEVYQYQTVCLCALNNEIQRYIDYKKARFMEANNYKRLTAARADVLYKEYIAPREYFKMLKAVQDQLHNKVF